MWLQSFKNPILCKSFSCSNVFPFHEVLCTQKSSITYFLHSYLLHGWHLQLPPHYTPVGWALLVRKCFIFPAKNVNWNVCLCYALFTFLPWHTCWSINSSCPFIQNLIFVTTAAAFGWSQRVLCTWSISFLFSDTKPDILFSTHSLERDNKIFYRIW